MTDERWYARAVFFVNDGEEALEFYRRMGFHEAWRYEEEGKLIAFQVDHQGAELILNRRPDRAGGGRLFLSLNRGQVAKCAERFTATGIEVRDSHWGMPVKIVTDPDGNELLFVDDDMTEGA
jgi:catechol 2,3-dioxygenase-like lactoylglutathione lyase family enzyme